MQNEDQNSLIKELTNFLPKTVIVNKNKAKAWDYGYNEKYDFIVISKTGEIQDIIEISGIRIALPKPPKKIHSRSKKKSEQYWESFEYPKNLQKIKSIFQWQIGRAHV